MKKDQIRGIVVLAILAVVYSVVVFLVPFAKTAVFWLSYLFTLVALVGAGYAAKTAFQQGNPQSKFYGFPIAKLGVIYFIIQLVLGLVFMGLSKIVPLWIPVVLYVVLLGAAAIGLIAADATREEVQRQDVQLKKDVSAMRALQSKANALVNQAPDGESTAALTDLADALRYSDPVSSEATGQLEVDLAATVDELQQAVVEGDQPAIQALCRKATAVLAERNRVCKLNK
jgi:protein-S-isoprenylcysteine O-methyltransferase Ste14